MREERERKRVSDGQKVICNKSEFFGFVDKQFAQYSIEGKFLGRHCLSVSSTCLFRLANARSFSEPLVIILAKR